MKYSNSYLQSYKNCPLQCYLTYEVGLKKIEDEAEEHHLRFGSAMHEGLKHIYLGDSLDSAKSAFKEAYPTQLNPDDHAKTQVNGLVALDGYVKRWALEDTKWKVVSVEERESFDYGQDEQFSVKLDLVMENKEYGGVYGFDHKVVGGTNSTLSYDFWGQFEPNSQISKYVSFIKSKHGDCSGFYINAIGMGHRLRAYKGEPAGFWVRYERQMFNRNVSQLDVEQADTSYWIKRIEESKQLGHWGYNTSQCKFCSFKPICSAGWVWPTDAELIEINYTRQGSPQETTKETKSCQAESSS